MRLKALERGVEGSLVVEPDEIVFGSGARGGSVERFGMVFEEDGARSSDAGTGGEKGIAKDAEHPGLEVCAWLEGIEGAECFGEGFLHEVFGLVLVAGEPVGVVVERGEQWERELFEVSAAGGGGRHGAERLGVSEVAG